MKVFRKIITGLGLFFTIAQSSFGQAVPATPQFESLKLSSSPAYVILGVEPENISRPTSPSEFVTGIQTAIVNGKLSPNFAMEFTPYFFKNPIKDPQRFKPLEYVAPEKNILKNICKTFSFSLGTSATDSVVFGNLKAGTAMGLGVRFTLIEGKPSSGKLKDLLDWNEAFVKRPFLEDIDIKLRQLTTPAESSKAIEDERDIYKTNTLKNLNFNLSPYEYSKRMIDEITDEIIREIEKNGLSAAKNFVNEKLEEYKATEKKLLTSINKSKYPFAKQGFMLEAAAGEAILFQNSKWTDYAHAKAAIWITPSYRWDVSDKQKNSILLLDAMGVARYTFNNKKDSVDVSDYLDFGGKCKLTGNRWSSSLEYVYRYALDLKEISEKNYTYRFTALIDYKINELLTLKGNLGVTFNGSTVTYTDPKKIFALAGLNVSLFNHEK